MFDQKFCNLTYSNMVHSAIDIMETFLVGKYLQFSASKIGS